MISIWLLGSIYVALGAALAISRRRPAPEKSVAAAPSGNMRSAPRAGSATFPEAPDALQKLAVILPALQHFAIAEAETGSRQGFCELLLSNARRIINAEHGALLAWDEMTAELQVIVATGSTGAEGFRIESPQTLTQRAFRSREMQIDEDANRVLITIPVMAQSKPIGVIQLQSNRRPTELEKRCLALLAGEGEVILHELNLFERLQAFHMELVETLYRTVHAMDPVSSNNAERTRLLARRLAQNLKMPDSIARYVEYAALLRGVGKIGIDQTILHKPGKLTPKEYEEIKKHTMIGHQILAEVKLLAPAAQMVLYHQEWFNGRGYPKGLKGEDIPLGARIIAVISAWEAMTTDRPYRKALSAEQALAELTRASGTQFDPAVVDAFRRIESAEAKG